MAVSAPALIGQLNSTANQSTAYTTTTTASVASGELAIIHAMPHGTTPPEPIANGGAVTINGTNAQLLTGATAIRGNFRTAVYWAVGPFSSGVTVSVDNNGFAGTGMDIYVQKHSGADTTTPLQQAVATANGNTSPATAALGTTPVSYVAASLVCADATAFAAAAGWTEQPTDGGTHSAPACRSGTVYDDSSPAADPSVTIGAANWAIVVYELAAAAAGTSVTPSPASLTTARFAPTVTASSHQLVTPGVAALATGAFAPTVTASDHQTVTPGALSLSTSAFAPTITASDHQAVSPALASLSLSPFAPTVTATAHVSVTPSTAALATATFAPTINVGNAVSVEPDSASLSLSAFAPSVATTAHRTVIPAPAALSLAGLAPTVTASAHRLVTPGVATLTLTTFAPTIGASVEIDLGSVAVSVALRDGLTISAVSIGALRASVSGVGGIAVAAGSRDGSTSSTTLRDGVQTHHE